MSGVVQKVDLWLIVATTAGPRSTSYLRFSLSLSQVAFQPSRTLRPGNPKVLGIRVAALTGAFFLSAALPMPKRAMPDCAVALIFGNSPPIAM
jgi:hypothetical protein